MTKKERYLEYTTAILIIAGAIKKGCTSENELSRLDDFKNPLMYGYPVGLLDKIKYDHANTFRLSAIKALEPLWFARKVVISPKGLPLLSVSYRCQWLEKNRKQSIEALDKFRDFVESFYGGYAEEDV